MTKQAELTKPQTASSSIVKYETYDESDTQEQLDDIDRQSGPSIWLKVEPDSKLRVRLLPPPAGEGGQKRPRWRALRIHNVPIPGLKSDVRVVCPAQWTDVYNKAHSRGACPVCAEVLRIQANADRFEQASKIAKADAERDRAKALRAKRRCFVNVIVRGREDEGPKLWDFGGSWKADETRSMEGKLLHIIKSDDDDGGPNINHPVKGYDIVIHRTGSEKQNTNYTISVKAPSVLDPDPARVSEWISNQHNIDSQRQFSVMSAADILKVLNGEKPGGDDEEERPRRRLEQRSANEPVDTIDADIEVEI